MAKKINNKGKNNTEVNKRSNKKRQKQEKIDLDNEIIIGVNLFPQEKQKNNSKEKKRKQRKDKKNTEDVEIKKNYIYKKKRLNIARISKLIFGVLLIIIMIIFVMTTPIFYIKNIEIEGTEKITKERIESLSQIKLDVNTFRYSKREITKNIMEEPYIKTVKIKRKLPETIQIIVTERKTKFLIQYSSSYIYVDDQGYILEISNEPIDVPIMYGMKTPQEKNVPGNRLELEDLEKMNIILKVMECVSSSSITQKITGIDISSKDDIILKMENDKKTVYIGDETNLNDKIIKLKVILDKEVENDGEIFIKDINKSYFRPKQ